MSRLMMLAIIYTFSINDTEKILQLPNQLEFTFDGVFPNVIIAYALVLAFELDLISRDGQRLFDFFEG